MGKILVVGADGNLTLIDMPEGGASGDVIGVVDENNNIVITGDLASGTYVFKYEGADGTYIDIGSLVVGGVVEYSITSTLTNCTASNGNAEIIAAGGTATLTFVANDGFALTETVEVVGATYTWDASTGILVLSEPTGDVTITVVATKSGYTNIIDTVGYENDMRLSSSGVTKKETGFVSTGMIDISAYSAPVTIRTKGVNFNHNGYCYFVLYKADGSLIAYTTLPSMVSNGAVWNFFTATADADGNVVLTKTDDQGADYLRITGYGSGENLIVTINEEIAE